MRKHEGSYILRDEVYRYGGEYDMWGYALSYDPVKDRWTTWKFVLKNSLREYCYPMQFKTAEEAKRDYHRRLEGAYARQIHQTEEQPEPP